MSVQFPCKMYNDYVLYLSASEEKVHSAVGITSAEQHIMSKSN